jgi:hypothetical protein
MPDENVPHTEETLTLSVFISSPGDLVSTRSRAKEVIDRMSGRVIDGRRVIFKPMLYAEHTPAIVGYSPQEAVDYFMGCANQMNIYVGMLWSRMGSEVVIKGWKHPSGTRYEFDSAYRGFRMDARPLMLLYRCEAPPPANSTPETRAAVADFFKGFKGLHPQYDGFPQAFVSDDDFAALLVRDLDQLARRIIAAAAPIENARELAGLVGSVRKWLATFEDLFGKDLQEDQERERDRPFPIHFRKLPESSGPTATPASDLLPGENKTLLDLFDDQKGGRMLMVGERGTGKTFAMLRLMQDLADRACIHRGKPVPVFFNLSSWSETYHEGTRQPSFLVRMFRRLVPQSKKKSSETLFQWLEDQLVRNYSMQRSAANRLLGKNQVILCLDGLDELGAGSVGDKEAVDKASRELRDACVKAINRTLKDNLSVPMILCCREETYHELTVKPDMGAPLQTQMLTAEEVIDDLQHWDKLEGLKIAISESPFLKERARVALFLSMMRIAYRDMSARHILQVAALKPAKWEKHLMDNYVDGCMKLAPPESQELNYVLVPDCLSWIAQQPDNDFLLDDLQPSVLRADKTPEGEKLWDDYRWMSIAWLAVSLMLVESLPTGAATGIEWGFYTGIGAGVWHGLKMLLVSFCILTPLYCLAFSAKRSLLLGFSFGLAWALDSAACDYLGVPRDAIGYIGSKREVFRLFLVSLPCAVIVFTLVGACTVCGPLAEHKERYKRDAGIEWYEILPIEPLHWCWFNKKSIWRGAWIGFLVGPLVLLLGWLGGQMERAMVAAPINMVLVGAFGGFSGSGMARVSIEPNQGVRRSLRHALLMTGVLVTCGSLTWGGVYFHYHGLAEGLVGFVLGLTLAFSFFIFGGIPVIRQFCLGCVLHQQGKLPTWYCWPPWKATVKFLDDLVRYKLLRRGAGGYMFRHQSLRDYYRTLRDHTET